MKLTSLVVSSSPTFAPAVAHVSVDLRSSQSRWGIQRAFDVRGAALVVRGVTVVLGAGQRRVTAAAVRMNFRQPSRSLGPELLLELPRRRCVENRCP